MTDGMYITTFAEAHEWTPEQAERFFGLARRHAASLTYRHEQRARALILASLRPRLRWAADRPRALRHLRRLGLWTPPTMPLRFATTTAETAHDTAHGGPDDR